MLERLPVGLIVNPIAGMGGSVGLKGTDSAEVLQAARSLGAEPLAARRTKRTLEVLQPAANSIRLLVAPHAMGQDLLEGLGLEFDVIGKISGATSSSADTVAAAKALVKAGARFILFSGGDGTARDLLDAVGDHVPLIGIPCGVKMYSGVFATSPEAAGHLARDFVDLINTRAGSSEADTILAEVMDIDEADYRKGRLSAELFGYARCPRIANRLQGPKVRSSPTHDAAVMSAATEIVESMRPGQVYLVGPGKSAKAVLELIGLKGTLLGIDALQDRILIGSDLNADGIARITGSRPAAIILGVIGGQGYVLGRGNQQISADVIRNVGRDGLIVISSEDKLARLTGERLFVDSGEPGLDKQLEGFIHVHTGFGRRMMMRLSAGH